MEQAGFLIQTILTCNSGGVQLEQKGGVKVNEYLQSVSNPSVYAAGDAAATKGIPLTPVASYEGQIVRSKFTRRQAS